MFTSRSDSNFEDRTSASKKINRMVLIRTLFRLLRLEEQKKNLMVFGRL